MELRWRALPAGSAMNLRAGKVETNANVSSIEGKMRNFWFLNDNNVCWLLGLIDRKPKERFQLDVWIEMFCTPFSEFKKYPLSRGIAEYTV